MNSVATHPAPRSTANIGVLLANLGTPDAPTPKAVRRFLAEFLSDPRVIDYPRLLWLPILYGVILQIRPRRSAHAYQQIWTADGSPLLIESRKLAATLQAAAGTDYKIALGMTYGTPSIASALRELRDANVERIVVIPLYPQYSLTTTASVFDRVEAELKSWRTQPAVRRVEHYHSEPKYLDALAESVREHWKTHPRKHLLFSFHGIPQRYVDNGDPYFDHCMATARGAIERLQLADSEWTVAFQSRVTRERWLEPYTDRTLARFAATGPKDVAVICPAFATDCLETLEEIALRNREDFLKAGGASFDYIPCLNAHASHVDMFLHLLQQGR
ncbi:MAG TPA: ferrochelatase [Steroidobacteraceae bacterium]|nr:ferrochelatase [Steroidobacteraceae bacterium]